MVDGPLPTLTGALVTLRPATSADVPVLAALRATPEVYHRWGGSTDLPREIADELADPDTATFAIEHDGQLVGAIQYHEETDPMYRHAGMDIFLDPAVHGRGLGTDAVRTLARHLVRDRGHHRLTIDPAADNLPAIRSYEKVGFRAVGVMRRYERGPDGTWHDGLLMDLLADELADDGGANRARMVDMTLPALPEESFQRVLCVVAHPDDMEYGTSAAVARWTARGIEVGYLLLTRGEAGMPNPPEETARLRVAEQRTACAVVGVKHLTVLEHPDGVLVYGLDLRRGICREIRRFKPDVVLATGYEIETPYGFDQADHRAAGLATLDAVRDAGNRWVFPEQIDDETLEPHSVRWLIVPGLAGAGATHGVEVTGEPLRRGVASLEAHAAYLAALPDHPAPADIIPTFTAMSGKAMGVEHAVLFRAHDLQAPPEFFTEAMPD